MKLRNAFILLFVLTLLDSYLIYVSPPDFTYTSMSFVPHIAFMALLLLTYDKSDTDRILIGLLVGLITDFFFMFSFPIDTILYPMFCWAVGKIYQRMHKDFRWTAVSCICSVILLDTLPFLFFKLIRQLHVSFIMWFAHMEIMTLVFHLLIMFALYYSIQRMNRISERRQMRKKKKERNTYRKLRSMRK